MSGQAHREKESQKLPAEEEELFDDVERNEAAWARREAARNRQVMIGKARPEYRRYIAEVPIEQRRPSQPRTPDPRDRVSKRQFDHALGEWRRRLHEYDGSAERPAAPGGQWAAVSRSEHTPQKNSGKVKPAEGRKWQKRRSTSPVARDSTPRVLEKESCVVRIRLAEELATVPGPVEETNLDFHWPYSFPSSAPFLSSGWDRGVVEHLYGVQHEPAPLDLAFAGCGDKGNVEHDLVQTPRQRPFPLHSSQRASIDDWTPPKELMPSRTLAGASMFLQQTPKKALHESDQFDQPNFNSSGSDLLTPLPQTPPRGMGRAKSPPATSTPISSPKKGHWVKETPSPERFYDARNSARLWRPPPRMPFFQHLPPGQSEANPLWFTNQLPELAPVNWFPQDTAHSAGLN
mmetsp:Transcript_41111/g.108827  ORF Transcript_41111/g.108827 Transcript_41111/m.108827 type:complete len:404 (-) Transcript_41111:250-1461(-)|eukprot:CAMPEP_0194503430 /NCGR_PEP_ID=MMETSP0253-20130528/28375_1 /TAXON_ID=2966 /ORGANISM="Noctiluca scintillans" /LENGTH=403 /DNA_ID=CAMNT_0039345713 /DNA_START=46 /DNA_END=1257 /DNA_ORIENTATION=+